MLKEKLWMITSFI